MSTSLVDSDNDDEEKMSAGLVVFISVRAALPQELFEAERRKPSDLACLSSEHHC